MGKFVIYVVALMFLSTNALGESEDILIEDFEGDTYGNWRSIGNAFGSAPCKDKIPGVMGEGCVDSRGQEKSDEATGDLIGRAFEIERNYINLLVGGGVSLGGRASVNLIMADKIIASSAGRGAVRLEWATWDVRKYKGRWARIEVVDKFDSWDGFILMDHPYQSDTPKVNTEPEVLNDEKYRPQFHFTPLDSWMQDPHGLIHYKGQYHLFYQWSPSEIKGTAEGCRHWGHATSGDMVNWERQDVAVKPSENYHALSGSGIVDQNNAMGLQAGDEKTLLVFYTHSRIGQCLSYSNDCGRTWKNYEGNPIMPGPGEANRDPRIFWHEPTKKWLMILSHGWVPDNSIHLYASDNLQDWEHVKELKMPADFFECPDLFELPVDGDPKNKKWVMTNGNARYMIGDFNGTDFIEESGPHAGDYGGNYYATQTWDIAGRRVQIAWMQWWTVYPSMPFNQQLSFPCDLTLRSTPDGIRMFRYPVDEIRSNYAEEFKWTEAALEPGQNVLSGVTGDLFDIEAEIQLRDAKEVGFNLRGETVSYDVSGNELLVLGAKAPLRPIDGKVKFRILLDRASVEVYGNDGVVVFSRCFLPKDDGDKTLAVYANGGSAQIVSLEVRKIRSIWK